MSLKPQPMYASGLPSDTDRGDAVEKKFLIFEFLLVFGVLPLLVLALKDRGFMIMPVWGAAVIVYFVLHRWYERSHATEWNWTGFKKGGALIVIRFACVAPVITCGAWLLFSGTDQFLSLPRARPEMRFFFSGAAWG